jgi:hypothetical protein
MCVLTKSKGIFEAVASSTKSAAWSSCIVAGPPTLRENATFFLSFSYVCPEPVLGKMFIVMYKMAPKRGVFLTLAESRPI